MLKFGGSLFSTLILLASAALAAEKPIYFPRTLPVYSGDEASFNACKRHFPKAKKVSSAGTQLTFTEQGDGSFKADFSYRCGLTLIHQAPPKGSRETSGVRNVAIQKNVPAVVRNTSEDVVSVALELANGDFIRYSVAQLKSHGNATRWAIHDVYDVTFSINDRDGNELERWKGPIAQARRIELPGNDG